MLKLLISCVQLNIIKKVHYLTWRKVIGPHTHWKVKNYHNGQPHLHKNDLCLPEFFG